VDDEPAVRKLKAMKSRLTRTYKIARLRVFDPAVTGAHENSSSGLGVLLDFEETPSLFDLSAIQNELEDELGISISLAVTGMIRPEWENRIRDAAVDV
jgi:predicted nucleotidyltransferase